MSWEAIRGMTGESFIEWCERNDYDLSSDSARRLLVEAKALLKEHDQAVELLMRAAIVVLAVESQKQQHSPFSTALRNIPTLASEIMEFLRELEGSDRGHERANETGKIEENK